MPVRKKTEQFCEARTWAQDRAPGWGDSQIGCLRKAQGQTEDGHWACSQHLNRAPANGWN
jgi:hypothetical protein